MITFNGQPLSQPLYKYEVHVWNNSGPQFEGMFTIITNRDYTVPSDNTQKGVLARTMLIDNGNISLTTLLGFMGGYTPNTTEGVRPTFAIFIDNQSSRTVTIRGVSSNITGGQISCDSITKVRLL